MKREDMFGNIEILLYDILQELKKLNEKENNEYSSTAQPEVIEHKKRAPRKRKEGAKQ